MIVEFVMYFVQAEACLAMKPLRWLQYLGVVGLMEEFLSPFGLAKKT
jgi:hypothetical protein